jgi:hypothetical protein
MYDVSGTTSDDGVVTLWMSDFCSPSVTAYAKGYVENNNNCHREWLNVSIPMKQATTAGDISN